MCVILKWALNDCLGPSQSAPGQYPNYPQGQGQQYGAYRPPQPGPPQGQQQRPYGYDQVSIPASLDSRWDPLIHSFQVSRRLNYCSWMFCASNQGPVWVKLNWTTAKVVNCACCHRIGGYQIRTTGFFCVATVFPLVYLSCASRLLRYVILMMKYEDF